MDVIQQQDEARTARSFISFLSTAFGVEQSIATQDGYSYSPPRQYQSVGAMGYSVEGMPQSSLQSRVTIPSNMLLLAAGAAAIYFLSK